MLLVVAAILVVALAVSQRKGRLPPFIACRGILVGLVCFEVWSIRHRRDDR
jgi:Na+/melibiose symporter-like transporter